MSTTKIITIEGRKVEVEVAPFDFAVRAVSWGGVDDAESWDAIDSAIARAWDHETGEKFDDEGAFVDEIVRRAETGDWVG